MMTVVSLDLDLIVDVEAGVFPGEELLKPYPLPARGNVRLCLRASLGLISGLPSHLRI